MRGIPRGRNENRMAQAENTGIVVIYHTYKPNFRFLPFQRAFLLEAKNFSLLRILLDFYPVSIFSARFCLLGLRLPHPLQMNA